VPHGREARSEGHSPNGRIARAVTTVAYARIDVLISDAIV
jgi:hypothetical protein